MKRLRSRLRASFTGLSPDSIALIVTLGLTLGVFPVYGAPTLLCAAVSLLLRLNLPAIQLVNQLTTPLQLAMLFPFLRLGSQLFPAWHSLGAGAWMVHAVAGWFLVCLPAGILLYVLLALLLRCVSACQLTKRAALAC